MEGAEVTNGEAAAREEANEGKDAEEAVANQQRDEQLAVANGAALLQCSSNEDTEPRERSNDSKEPEAANGNAARKSPTNENTAHKSAINENTAHKSPANENTAQKSPANENTAHKSPTNEDRPATTNKDAASQDPTNQDGAGGAAANVNSTRQPPPNEDSPSQDPANDLAPLPAAANQPPDPWDWSLEEAWLREPEGEELEEEWAELDEQGADLEEQRAELEDEWAEPSHTESAARWWSSPDGTWSKLIVRPGRGLARPGPGSRCRVLLTVPRSGRRAPPSSASGSGRWLTVRVGAAEGRWSCLLDAALETMAGGELARVRPSGASAATVAVRLGRFTAAPPFWAASPSSRWRSVASGHARAAALLARGLLGAAARAYSRALRAAVLAAGAASPPPEAAEVKAELHAGLALVQLRLGLPAAAAANAGKALALRPTHLEARYRRAVAQAAMMDLEAAMADLVAILRAQPGHAGARRELRRVRGAARERDARLARRLGRLFA